MILNTKHGQNLGKPKIQLDIYYAAIRGKDYMDDNNLKKKNKNKRTIRESQNYVQSLLYYLCEYALIHE